MILYHFTIDVTPRSVPPSPFTSSSHSSCSACAASLPPFPFPFPSLLLPLPLSRPHLAVHALPRVEQLKQVIVLTGAEADLLTQHLHVWGNSHFYHKCGQDSVSRQDVEDCIR